MNVVEPGDDFVYSAIYVVNLIIHSIIKEV